MKNLLALLFSVLALTGVLQPLANGQQAGSKARGRAYLGVQIGPDARGIKILTVRPDSAAAQAGLQEGDVLLALDGEKLSSLEALIDQLKKLRPGAKVVFHIQRGERALDTAVLLGARPQEGRPSAPAAPPAKRAAKAPTAPPAPARKGGYLGVMIDNGEDNVVDAARIDDVRPDGPADRGRLRKGDVIVAIDGAHVAGVDDLKKALEDKMPGDEVQVTILRKGKKKQRMVRLASFDQLDWPGPVAELQQPGVPGLPFSRRRPPKPENRKASAPIVRDARGARDAQAAQGWLGVYYGESKRGVRIENTVPGSPAEKAGLRAGDVIVSLSDQKIDDPEGLRNSLQRFGPESKIAVTVLRGDKPLEFDVTLSRRPDVVMATPTPGKGAEARADSSGPGREMLNRARLARAQASKAKKANLAKKNKKAKLAKKARKKAKAMQSEQKGLPRLTLRAEHSLRLRMVPSGGFVLEAENGSLLKLPTHGRRIMILEANGDDGIVLRPVQGMTSPPPKASPGNSRPKVVSDQLYTMTTAQGATVIEASGGIEIHTAKDGGKGSNVIIIDRKGGCDCDCCAQKKDKSEAADKGASH